MQVSTLARNKILLLILLLCIISVFLGGCDIYYGRRPFDYPNTVWICEDPLITVKIGPNNETLAYLGSEKDGQEFWLLFGYGRNAEAHLAKGSYVSNDTILFKGVCLFSKDHFIIGITEDRLWGGIYDNLRFVRIDP